MGNYQLYIAFAVYLVIILGIGVYAYVSTKNFADYILGGRKMGGFVTAMSAGASDMSGWLLLGLPGAIYASGLAESWIAIGLVIGAYFNYVIVAGRLRVFTETYSNALTIPEYLGERFPEQKKPLRIIASFVIIFFFTIYCASGIVAGAKLFESLFDIPYNTAIWYGALATIIYTFIGGYLAVSWSDTIQATLMIFALLLAPIVILLNLGWTNIETHLAALSQAKGINYSSLFEKVSLVGVISSLSWGLGYFGQPHILVRFMAADSVQSINKARRIGITWMILCLGGACLVGYFGLAYFTIHPAQNVQNENVFIEVSKAIFNPWIAGIVLSGILAAIMSTLSAQLLMSASVITEDFYRGFIRKNASSNELTWVGRFLVIVIAIIAIKIAYDPTSKVMGLVAYAWAGFGASFGPVMILSLFKRNISCTAVLLGMICGAITVVGWAPFTNYLGFTQISKLYEIIPGFIVCGIVVLLGSVFIKADKVVEAKFDVATNSYQLAKENNAN